MIMKINDIQNKLSEIKELTGLELTLCDYFTGVCDSAGSKYFNATLDKAVWDSPVYDKLLGIIKFGTISKVEPNGLKRVAIFF